MTHFNLKFTNQAHSNTRFRSPYPTVQRRNTQLRHNSPTNKPNHGFTLLEVLISLVIFSLGALSLITLQIKTTQASHQAHLNTLAMSLLQDMAGRIRSNHISAKAGHYLKTNTTTTTDCSESNCSPTQIAQYDKQVWLQRIKNTLPKAKTKIQLKDNQYTLTLYWHSQTAYRVCAENNADSKGFSCETIRVNL